MSLEPWSDHLVGCYDPITRTRNEALVGAAVIPSNRSCEMFVRHSPVMQLLESGPMSSIKIRVGRAVLLIAIVVLHLLLVLRFASRPTEPTVRPSVLNVFTIPSASGHGTSAPPAKQKQAERPRHVPVVIVHRRSPIVTESPPSANAEAAPHAGVAAGGCALARDAGEAIEHDAAAMAELDALPPTIRTSADAVILWNG